MEIRINLLKDLLILGHSSFLDTVSCQHGNILKPDSLLVPSVGQRRWRCWHDGLVDYDASAALQDRQQVLHDGHRILIGPVMEDVPEDVVVALHGICLKEVVLSKRDTI